MANSPCPSFKWSTTVFSIIDELLLNQVGSPLNGWAYAREPGQFSHLVEKDGVPSCTKLEGTDVIPKWETECARHAP